MKSRVFGLDLLRTLAMISVIMSHEGHDRLFGIKYGIIAVESFFVMSGYLIGEMLIRDFRDGFSFSDLKTFWIKRWFRTLPLYYTVILAKFIFLDSSPGWNILNYFLFLQNNFYGISFLGISWTLVLEEWFYLLMPLLFLLLFRNGIQSKKFFSFIVIFCILTLAARFVYAVYFNRPFTAVNGNFPFRFDSFLVGVGLSAIKIFHPEFFKKMGEWRSFLLFLLLFFILMFFFKRNYGITEQQQYGLFIRTVWFSLISISLASILPFLCQISIFSNYNPKNPFFFLVTWGSLLSYPVYLIHMDVFVLVDKWIPRIYSWHEFFGLSLKMMVVIAISLVLYYGIHDPFIKLRTKIINKKSIVVT